MKSIHLVTFSFIHILIIRQPCYRVHRKSPASMRQLDFVRVRIIDAATAEKITNRIWTED